LICAVSSSVEAESLTRTGFGGCELDSHADTCVVGSNFVLLEHTSKTIDVHSYSKELNVMRDIPIATAATVWTKPHTGESYLLVFNQCIFFGNRLKHSLVCPNQLQAHGVVVHDVPSQFDRKSKHAIVHEELFIPLKISGVISYFDSRLPQEHEIDSLPNIHLTAPADWQQFSTTVADSEPRTFIALSSLSTQPSMNGPYRYKHLPEYQSPELLDD
jgi:hypothetical protein